MPAIIWKEGRLTRHLVSTDLADILVRNSPAAAATASTSARSQRRRR